MKKRITAILLAWLLFIGTDFLFHASIFASLWEEDIAALKSLENLALLIPAGYCSFFLLTILVGYLFFTIFREKPPIIETLKFAVIFGLLFSLSNLLGLYSYVAIPFKQLLVFNLIYFIEIVVVVFSLYYVAFSAKFKKSIWLSISIFFILVLVGIVIQNIL